MATNTRIAKACKAMKNLGYLEKIVKPVVKELLELYENKWMLIEEYSYQVLVDAILDSEEQKARSNELENLNAWSEDEAEETEPLLKRSKLSSQKNQPSTSFHASILNCCNEINEDNGPIFNYIIKNVTYQNAYMRFLLAHTSEEIVTNKELFEKNIHKYW